MISSVSRAVLLVTTPTHPAIFQAIILFEPMEPVSLSPASSMTRTVPLRIRGINGSEEILLYQLPTQASKALVSIAGACGLFVGTYLAVTAIPCMRCV